MKYHFTYQTKWQVEGPQTSVRLEPDVSEEILTDDMEEVCAFCNRKVPTRGHHIVPRCKGGREIAPTCHSCEDFIHKTWSHNELRDTFNTVETILADVRFQKFLKWLHKQQDTAMFRSQRGRARRVGKYR